MTVSPMTRPLLEMVPGLRDRVAWQALGSLPTPLERVEVSGRGFSRSILVKRDDLSGTPYGGNKVRKLEFILAAARAAGAERLITAGAAGSHHALATTVYGSEQGFAISLVLFPQRVTDHVRTVLLLDQSYGAELRWTRRMEGVPMALWRARRAHRSESPLVITPGGSNEIGTLGYVNAGLELAAQLDGTDERISAVYVAAGTLGTTAGLAIGLTMGGHPLHIEAARITSKLVANEGALRKLITRTVELLRATGAKLPSADEIASRVRLRDDQIGAGYGRSTPAAERAREIFARSGLTLDPTYTAKAAAAMFADAVPATGMPLYIHTLSAVEPLDRLDGVTIDDLPRAFARYLHKHDGVRARP